jgi:hypothetical protein
MTKLVTVITLFFLPFLAFSQTKSLAALEKKYNNDNAFSLSLTGNILGFLSESKFVQNDPELRRFTKKVQSLRILAVSNKSKNYSPRDIRKLKAEIRKQSFEELISVKSDNGQLQLMVRDQQGKPGELLMIIDKDTEGFITLNLSESDPD